MSYMIHVEGFVRFVVYNLSNILHIVNVGLQMDVHTTCMNSCEKWLT